MQPWFTRSVSNIVILDSLPVVITVSERPTKTEVVSLVEKQNPPHVRETSAPSGSSMVLPIPNIIVFGETGAGKSSVINMLEGNDKAEVSSSAKGVTFTSAQYRKTISGTLFKVFDTAGLNEGAAGAIPARAASRGLSQLLRQLEGSLNLLIYVMRAPRITETAQKNYEIFFTVLCQKAVPIVVIVTGLEDEDNMDDWWEENKQTFDRYEMKFTNHACITARRGKLVDGKHRAEDEYAMSKKKVENMIYNAYRRDPWTIEPQSLFDLTLGYFRTRVLGMSDATESVPNVVVFGEVGCGKGSVINMLEGGERAPVSDRAAVNPVFTNTSYSRRVYGTPFTFFETAGLTVNRNTQSARGVIEQLYKLIRQLEYGVHLLVYVMRSPRIADTAAKNYEIFHQIFCQSKVPIVIIITGLESRTDMDGWWVENESVFSSSGMSFQGHACITADPGKKNSDGETHVYGKEYEESKEKVEQLIHASYVQHPWTMPPKSWFNTVVVSVHKALAKVLRLERSVLSKELYDALKKYGGLSEREAMVEANKIYKRYNS